MSRKWEHSRVTRPPVAAGRELGRVEFGPDDLRRVRDLVGAVARERIPHRVNDAMLSVHEVAVNSIVHGGGRGVLRIEETADSIVFTVEDDDGTGSVPSVSVVDEQSTSGRGLWIAQESSDLLTVDVRSTSTRVSVHVRLAP
jgi:anti-sigma regulatory factor (Ser/Thr protein kinase)